MYFIVIKNRILVNRKNFMLDKEINVSGYVSTIVCDRDNLWEIGFFSIHKTVINFNESLLNTKTISTTIIIPKRL